MASTRIRFLMMASLAALVLLVGAPHSSADEKAEAENPLEPFSRLVGGEWHSQNSFHVFEWGVGKRSILAKSYFVVGTESKQVSDGMWFWHPGVGAIKGFGTVIDMPFSLFDYTSTFEGNVLRSNLETYTSDGTPEKYVETWEFTDENTYVWKLLSESDEGLQEVMGSTYTRK